VADARPPIVVVGPTGSGKTAMALALAALDRSLVLCSIDAFACYRSMDIGTAKPTPAERARARWCLLDLIEPDEELSVVAFAAAATRALGEIAAAGDRALLVGGSSLYLRAVVDALVPPPRYPEVARLLLAEAARRGAPFLHARLAALDPLGASRMEPTNLRRVVRALEVTLGSGRPFSSFGPGLGVYPARPHRMIGLELSPERLAHRLARRLDDQLAAGFLEEVARLCARPQGLSRTAAQAIGYRELADVVRGVRSLEAARAEILRRSRALARRQMAWLRRDPRIVWIPAEAPDAVVRAAELADVTRPTSGREAV